MLKYRFYVLVTSSYKHVIKKTSDELILIFPVSLQLRAYKFYVLATSSHEHVIKNQV